MIFGIGRDVFERYTGTLGADVLAMVRRQAAKRVGLEFVPAAPAASWDHRKLGSGVY